MKKIIAVFITTTIALGLLAGCGDQNKDTNVTLEGSCEEILAQVYENAELDSDLRVAMEYYMTDTINEDMEEYILGTTEVDYSDAVYSMPMMNAVAYQCVILRVSEGQDVEAAKQLLTDNADPRKWVCVEPESILVENVGDVILYIMADEATAEAVKTAFLSLGEN